VKRAAGIFACLLLAACKGAQSALDPASEQAAHIDGMWRLLLWVCGIMYALVLAFLAWALWRARRRLAGPPIADSAESGAELRMRRALASWTALVVGGLILLSFGSFLVDRSLALAQSRDAVHIKITAQSVVVEGGIPGSRRHVAAGRHRQRVAPAGGPAGPDRSFGRRRDPQLLGPQPGRKAGPDPRPD
jgi:heme/copper-type cytochrome/quinol oxidase subunit 2